MLALALLISFFAIPCIVLAIIYYSFRMWRLRSDTPDTFQVNPVYTTMKNRRKKSFIALPITFMLFIAFAIIENDASNEAREKRLLAKAESYVGDDKNVFDRKFAEYSKTMEETEARKKAIEFTDKMKEGNDRINSLEGEEKDFWTAKYNEYKSNMDDADAKIKALNDLDAEIEKRNKELQKKYDDQKQYEEWIAWQKSEEEKKKAKEQKIAEEKNRQELQKKYDDQKKYEEWIAWQKAEDDKRLAAEAEERKRQEDERRKQEAERNKYSPVNASVLYNAYKNNAARANRDFSGKYIKITDSTVERIESEAKVVSTGIVQGNEYFSFVEGFIRCYPKTESAKSAIYNINNNQRIVIYGKVREVGEYMGYYIDVDRFEW